MIEKYIALGIIKGWIRREPKKYTSESIIWKFVVKAFLLIGRKLT